MLTHIFQLPFGEKVDAAPETTISPPHVEVIFPKEGIFRFFQWDLQGLSADGGARLTLSPGSFQVGNVFWDDEAVI